MQLLVITYYIDSSDKESQNNGKLSLSSTSKIINFINPTSEIRD